MVQMVHDGPKIIIMTKQQKWSNWPAFYVLKGCKGYHSHSKSYKNYFFDFHLNIVSMWISMSMSEFYQTMFILLDMTYIEFKVIDSVDFPVARSNQKNHNNNNN